ncbi:EamA family transporter [Bdellovibrio sp. qaytius]|nr:EamA family transporter [Bdellovibrio sp. qaytius]
MRSRLILLTTLTMIAFATNSIFCRLALTDRANDPLSFTIVRLASGAAILLIIFLKGFSKTKDLLSVKSAMPALMLFSYAMFFSFAYVQMKAGTGALIVFPTVQFVMLGYALYKGTKLQLHEKIGVLVALAGLVYLLLPGFDMPPLQASIFMMLSGVSWGVYSILGKSMDDPIFATAKNFIFTIPLVLILFLIFGVHLTPHGFLWAILSGSLTSGLGYLAWYIVLKQLDTSTAAVVHLSAPAIAAFGGILFLGEALTLRLVIASVLILGGLYIKTRGFRIGFKLNN